MASWLDTYPAAYAFEREWSLEGSQRRKGLFASERREPLTILIVEPIEGVEHAL